MNSDRLPTKDYLSTALGKHVQVVLHNESFSGRMVSLDMPMEVLTLEGTLGGEPYTVHIKTTEIEAIMIQDMS